MNRTDGTELGMTRTNLSMSISADGYVAGPDQSEENPLGVGGLALHGWHLGPAVDHPVNRQVMSDMLDGMGATIMGRNMFGPIRGEWGESDWRGWWGDTPPYHCPVFVLTHHAHDPIEMEGGTTFHFVTDGIESAYAQAKAAAGEKDISPGAPRVPGRRSRPASSTRLTCKWRRRFSAQVNGCSTASRPASPSFSSPACCTPPEWPTSATT